MSTATIIIAAHGAGLANVVFSPPGGVVIELFPALFQTDMYHYVTINSGHWCAASNFLSKSKDPHCSGIFSTSQLLTRPSFPRKWSTMLRIIYSSTQGHAWTRKDLGDTSPFVEVTAVVFQILHASIQRLQLHRLAHCNAPADKACEGSHLLRVSPPPDPTRSYFVAGTRALRMGKAHSFRAITKIDTRLVLRKC